MYEQGATEKGRAGGNELQNVKEQKNHEERNGRKEVFSPSVIFLRNIDISGWSSCLKCMSILRYTEKDINYAESL